MQYLEINELPPPLHLPPTPQKNNHYQLFDECLTSVGGGGGGRAALRQDGYMVTLVM